MTPNYKRVADILANLPGCPRGKHPGKNCVPTDCAKCRMQWAIIESEKEIPECE